MRIIGWIFTLNILFVFFACLLCNKFLESENKAIADDYNNVLVISGQDIAFSQSSATKTLKKWSAELLRKGSTATYGEAVGRERMVVQMVNAGKWPLNAYHEYQRMTAGTGNVDSAQLMLQYALIPSISLMKFKNELSRQFIFSLSTCDTVSLRKILQLHSYHELEGDDGTTALVAATFLGCRMAVKMLLEEGIDDIESSGSHGINALMTAAIVGNSDIIRILASYGANLQTRHRFAGTTPLHMAAEMNHPKAIRTLCNLGADVNARTSVGGTSLHTAADSNAAAAITTLITYHNCSADPSILMNGDTTPLYLAAIKGHTEATKALLAAGASPSFSMPHTPYQGVTTLTSRRSANRHEDDDGGDDVNTLPINSAPGNGAEAIHAAAENGYVATVKVLVEGGADINSLAMGVTPLMSAAQHNQPAVVQTLIELGADLEIHSPRDGATALYYACGFGFKEVVQILIKYGANVGALQTRAGGFPLLYAAGTKRYDIMTLLLEAGANPNQAASKNGLTALHVVASSDSGSDSQAAIAAVKALFQAGADISQTDSTGNSAIHYAVDAGSFQVLRYLLRHISMTLSPSKKSYEIIINAQTLTGGYTAFHKTCITGNVKQAKLLIGANVHLKLSADTNSGNDGGGTTALYLAVQNDNVEMVRLLLEGTGLQEIDVDETIGDRMGTTALLVAVNNGFETIVKLLLQPWHGRRGADPNKGASVGQSAGLFQFPLLLAVARGKAAVVGHLLDAGATCDVAVSHRGEIVRLVDIAKMKRDYDVIQVLSTHPSCTLSSSTEDVNEMELSV